jgi:CPA2 family monovalent cation:H+ antiporter-2
VALEAGLLLGQGGEFAFLVIGMAHGLGLMPNDTAQFMLIVAGLTMITTPPVAHFARKLARAMESREANSQQSDTDIPLDLSGHVIVAGYGRVGQMLGSVLDRQGLPHVGLDVDADLVARYRAAGAGIFFGDANRPDLLLKHGVDKAAALVVTMDSPPTVEQVVATARQNWPDLPIYARARDLTHAARLIALGASHAVPENVEASLQLGEMVLMGVGIPDQTARQIIEAQRQLEQETVDQGRRDRSR